MVIKITPTLKIIIMFFETVQKISKNVFDNKI